jgi:hypothetical protein
VHYWSGSRWEPACIFPNLEPETLFDPDKSDGWNEATEYCGLVPERMIRDNRVYWNFTVNLGGVPEGGTARLKVVRAGEGARPLSTEEIEVRPDYGDTVVLKNWHEWQGAPVHDYEGMEPNRQSDPADAPTGWCVANCTFGQPRLCCFGQEPVPPLRHNPRLQGKYDLYVCFKEERLECDLELPGRKTTECILLHTGLLPFYRFWKEFFIGQYDFTPDDTIGIVQSPSARVNRLRRFGDIFSLKLVPADRPAVPPSPPPGAPPKSSSTASHTPSPISIGSSAARTPRSPPCATRNSASTRSSARWAASAQACSTPIPWACAPTAASSTATTASPPTASTS